MPAPNSLPFYLTVSTGQIHEIYLHEDEYPFWQHRAPTFGERRPHIHSGTNFGVEASQWDLAFLRRYAPELLP